MPPSHRVVLCSVHRCGNWHVHSSSQRGTGVIASDRANQSFQVQPHPVAPHSEPSNFNTATTSRWGRLVSRKKTIEYHQSAELDRKLEARSPGHLLPPSLSLWKDFWKADDKNHLFLFQECPREPVMVSAWVLQHQGRPTAAGPLLGTGQLTSENCFLMLRPTQ